MKRLIAILGILLLAGCAATNQPARFGATGHDDSNTANSLTNVNPGSGSYGGNQYPSQLYTFLAQEDANRFYEQAFVNMVSTKANANACLGGTSAGLTMTPTACVAYNAGYRGTETGSITFSNNTTTWVAMDENTSGNNANLPNFTRVTGTHYLIDSIDATRPAMASDSQLLMKVTTSGGAITAVSDLRLKSPIANGGMQQFNILSYGAKCDNSTDDGPVINSTIAFLGGAYIPSHSVAGAHIVCKATTVLNLTNTVGAFIIGDSYGEAGNVLDTSSTIDCAQGSGATCIDAVGANDLNVRNLQLKYDASTSADIAIVMARSSVNGFAQHNTFDHLTISWHSRPAANGGVGTVGIYNYGAEIDAYYQLDVIDADVPVWLTPTNTQLGFSSSYATILTGQQSTASHSFYGASLLAMKGPVVHLGDTSQLNYVPLAQFYNAYLAHDTNYAGGGQSAYAIVADVAVPSMVFHGNVEHLASFLDLRSNESQHLELYPEMGAATNGTDIITLESNASLPTKISDGSVLDPSFNSVEAGNSPTAIVVDDSAGTHTSGVVNSFITIPHNGQVNMPNGTCNGDYISAEDASPTITGCSGAFKNLGGVVGGQLFLLTGNPQSEIGPSAATGNLVNQSIAGGTLGTGKAIQCVFDGTYFNNSGGNDTPAFEVLYDGSGAQCGGSANVASTNFNYPFHIVADISASGATNRQAIVGKCNLGSSNPASTNDILNLTSINNTTIDSTISQALTLFVSQGNNASINSKLYYAVCTVSN